ncbi:MAG: enoyl-CoA hydratase/isomerase family protein [Burkholderiales bacterium]|nr:enoyl-CoA hydratase/isomerase family protein [Burkholderiales bacterium]
MNRHIQTELTEQVLIVTLNRIAAQNALIPDLLSELIAVFSRLPSEPNVHAVVLQSASAAFSIGGDMHSFNRHFPDIRDYALDIVGKLNQMMLAMIDTPQPIVTAVHGVVTGGSMGFVLASDLVLVSPQVVFKAHYPSAGFSPDGGWGVLLPRIAGARRTAECLLLNKSFSAQQAVDWGVANAIIEQDKLRDEAQQVARKIAAYPAGTMRTSKQLLWRERAQIAADLELEREKFVELITRDDAQKGILRFLQTYKDYPPENLQ